MKKIIQIGGDLAALKSTIAKKLSKDLKLVLLSKDSIKEVLGNTIGFNNREENLKLSQATFELMMALSENMFDATECVVLESNFRENECERLNQWINDQKIDRFSLFLTGDFDILYQRYLLRQSKRHVVHQSTGLMTFSQFQQSKRLFSQELYGKNAIVIDTTNFSEENYQKILDSIKKWL
jgi:predicted kinase